MKDNPEAEEPLAPKEKPFITLHEEIALGIVGLMILGMLCLPEYFHSADYEWIPLIFFIFPAGMLIATDPVRRGG